MIGVTPTTAVVHQVPPELDTRLADVQSHEAVSGLVVVPYWKAEHTPSNGGMKTMGVFWL